MRNNMYRKVALSIYSIVILVIILGFHTLGVLKTGINYAALFSLIFATTVTLLIFLFCLTPLNIKRSMFNTIGITVTTIVYFASIITTVSLLRLFTNSIPVFIFVQVLLLAILTIIILIVSTLDNRIAKIEQAQMEDKVDNNPRAKRGGF